MVKVINDIYLSDFQLEAAYNVATVPNLVLGNHPLRFFFVPILEISRLF